MPPTTTEQLFTHARKCDVRSCAVLPRPLPASGSGYRETPAREPRARYFEPAATFSALTYSLKHAFDGRRRRARQKKIGRLALGAELETTRQFIRGRAVSVGEGRTASSKSHNLIQLLRRECGGTNDRHHHESFERAAITVCASCLGWRSHRSPAI